jgi:hypothetical protein
MVWQLLTWPAQSLLWLAEQIQERAEAQLDSKENLQKELTALQIQLDLGGSLNPSRRRSRSIEFCRWAWKGSLSIAGGAEHGRMSFCTPPSFLPWAVFND